MNPLLTRYFPVSISWLVVFLAGSLSAHAQTSGVGTTQTFQLQEGWNAIYLEVDPENPAPSEVFDVTDRTIQQVSGYFPRRTSAQFTGASGEVDPSFGRAGWLTWSSSDDAFNTLGKVLPHQAYLVKASGAATLTVNGKVLFHRIRWTPDAFNFLGFQVDPNARPTFRQFFEGSRAHEDLLIYQLSMGAWQRVAASARIEPGRAYWAYCRGGSNHQGPVDVRFPGFEQLNFGKGTDTITLDFRNDSLGAKTITVTQNGGLSLRYAKPLLDEGRTHWLDLADGPSMGPLAPEVARSLRIAVDRETLNGPGSATVTVAAAGMRLRIPTFAERLEAGNQIAGLWVGNVTIDKVSQISRQGAAADGQATPAGGQFNMRIILHGGANGGAKLLKAVSIMRKKDPGPDGTYQRVLLTNDNLIPHFGGVVRRGDKLVGQRIASPFFHFEGNELALGGDGISLGGGLSGTVVLPADHPTNPFRHQYHPDHVTGREVARQIAIAFTGGEGVEATDKPTQGQRLRGTYSEIISGLIHPNKGDLRLEGTIDIQLVSAIDVLTQSAP